MYNADQVYRDLENKGLTGFGRKSCVELSDAMKYGLQNRHMKTSGPWTVGTQTDFGGWHSYTVVSSPNPAENNVYIDPWLQQMGVQPMEIPHGQTLFGNPLNYDK